MAQKDFSKLYEIAYRCGHTGTIRVLGTDTTQEAEVEYRKTTLCPECRMEDRNRKGAYVTLEGSDKQIVWALDIRDGFIKAFKNLLIRIEEAPEKYRDGLLALADKYYHDRIAVTSAKLWIDSREYYHDERTVYGDMKDFAMKNHL